MEASKYIFLLYLYLRRRKIIQRKEVKRERERGRERERVKERETERGRERERERDRENEWIMYTYDFLFKNLLFLTYPHWIPMVVEEQLVRLELVKPRLLAPTLQEVD